MLCLLWPATASAQNQPDAPVSHTHLLRQLYTSGLARMAKGDPEAATEAFRIAAEVAPELPQMPYSLGLAQVLADWKKREQALPAIEAALRADGSNPLYRIAKVLADPTLSQLGRDGALHLSPAGAERLRAASAAVGQEKTAINGRYLAAVLGSVQVTGDARHPARLAGFDRMLGTGGTVRLPTWNDSQAFGRLFAAAVPDAALQAYEPRMIARLQQGLDSLNPENMRRLQMKGRLLAVRQQLSELGPLAEAGPLLD
jgi:tetratricopeptide (TPR) repeat protein